MSGIKIYPACGKHTPVSFFLSCLRTVFKEPLIMIDGYQHLRIVPTCIWQATLRIIFTSVKRPCCRWSTRCDLLIVWNPKSLKAKEVSLSASVVPFISSGEETVLFLLYTAKVGVTAPLTPSRRNSSNWEEDCVLKCLLAGGRAHVLDIDV